MNDLKQKLNGNGFLINIATLLAVVVTAISGALWISTILNDVNQQVKESMHLIRTDMARIMHEMDKRVTVNEAALLLLPAEDRWRGQDQIIWALRLHDQNPDIEVPDPSDIIRDRVENR